MMELKRCPFCGGDPRMMHSIDGTPSGVHCKCGAFVRFMSMPKVPGENFGATADRIAARYNQRAERGEENADTDHQSF